MWLVVTDKSKHCFMSTKSIQYRYKSEQDLFSPPRLATKTKIQISLRPSHLCWASSGQQCPSKSNQNNLNCTQDNLLSEKVLKVCNLKTVSGTSQFQWQITKTQIKTNLLDSEFNIVTQKVTSALFRTSSDTMRISFKIKELHLSGKAAKCPLHFFQKFVVSSAWNDVRSKQ